MKKYILLLFTLMPLVFFAQKNQTYDQLHVKDKAVVGNRLGVGTTSPAEKLDVNGGIKIGTTRELNAGTIRWHEGNFEGYDGSSWTIFGSGDVSGTQLSDSLEALRGEMGTSDTIITNSIIALAGEDEPCGTEIWTTFLMSNIITPPELEFIIFMGEKCEDLYDQLCPSWYDAEADIYSIPEVWLYADNGNGGYDTVHVVANTTDYSLVPEPGVIGIFASETAFMNGFCEDDRFVMIVYDGTDTLLNYDFSIFYSEFMIPAGTQTVSGTITVEADTLAVEAVLDLQGNNLYDVDTLIMRRNDGQLVYLVVDSTNNLIVGDYPVVPLGDALELTWDDIANVPMGGDAASVLEEWNSFFDLPTNGTPFTSVVVDGDVVKLYGGSGITLKAGLFSSIPEYESIIKVEDNAGCLVEGDYYEQDDEGFEIYSSPFNYYSYNKNTEEEIEQSCTSLTTFTSDSFTTAGVNCFYKCTSATTFDLPALTTAGDRCFNECTAATTFDLPSLTTAGDDCFINCTSATTFDLSSCTDLGGTTGDDFVFAGITGQTITLTCPAALLTCNEGAPDGDLCYLHANNTLTVNGGALTGCP